MPFLSENGAAPGGTLQDFYADPGALRQALQVADAAYGEQAAALIRTLAGFGITRSRVDVEDFAIFRHARLRQALDAFIAAHPVAPLPLEQITVVRFARTGRADADLQEARRLLADADEGIQHLARRCNIEVRLHVFVEDLDAEAAERLAEAAEASDVDALGFYFQFSPHLDARAAGALRGALARLGRSAALRSPKIVCGNFPFCFHPPESFRLAYREAVEPLRGHIGAQRDLVRKLAARAAVPYAAPCADCRCRAACHAYTDVAAHPACAPLLQPRRGDALVFAGGSVAAEDVPHDPALVWTGPADQGSLLAAVLEGFRTILIIDGYFYTRFPCTTFEVMLALEAGVRVLGSSSIGALRALELEAHGVEGVGEVFARLRREAVKPYHLVAQTYDERDQTLTLPPVQILDLLDQARDAGVLTDGEHAACAAHLDTIHFLDLTLAGYLNTVSPADLADRLRTFHARSPPGSFDVKHRDALRLLALPRTAAAGDAPAMRTAPFQRTRNTYLQRVFDKYRGEPEMTLPESWDTAIGDPACGTQDRRDAAPAETCERARRFFADLDVVVADTSRYDPSGHHILSVFFVPFYHLDYYPSSATGNGPTFDGALASAYMELVERLPVGLLHVRQRSLSDWGGAAYPTSLLPQFYNWGTDPAVQEKSIEDHGYIRVTELNAGRRVLIPKAAAMFAYSGTDGYAAGNSWPEAILYGLYELIERDTAQLHLVDPVLRARLPGFLLDPRRLDDPRCDALLAEVAAKGCRFLLFELPNTFGLPCVMCQVYDANRRIQSHGGIAVRAGLRDAAYAALREAYMQHITYFVGTRDDYRAFATEKRARLAYQNAQEHLFDLPGGAPRGTPAAFFDGTVPELAHVRHALTRGGLNDILVADTSPLPCFGLKSVKVIVPGLDLWFCPDYQPSPHLRDRAIRVRSMTNGTTT